MLLKLVVLMHLVWRSHAEELVSMLLLHASRELVDSLELVFGLTSLFIFFHDFICIQYFDL